MGSLKKTPRLAVATAFVLVHAFIIQGHSQQIVESLQNALSNKFLEAAGLGELSDSSVSDDTEHQKLLNETFDSVIWRKGQSYFTRSLVGGQNSPIEINGLELVGPRAQHINEADKLNGIEKRVHYSLRMKAWRKFDKETRWGEWKPGGPPLLTSFGFVLKNGTWEVTHSPLQYYSVEP